MRFFLYFGFLLGLATALGNFIPACEWFAHVQPWVLLIVILLGLLALARRAWVAFFLLLCVSIYHIAYTAPYLTFDFLNQQSSSGQSNQTEIRILQFNINADNGRFDDLATAIEMTDPDIMVICEANVHVLGRLSHLHNLYPFRIEAARWPNTTILGVSGTVLWSKFPFVNSESITLEKGKIQICHANVTINHQRENISIYAAHMLAPRNKQQITDRDNGLMELAQLIESDPSPTAMLIGDLNQSVWTPGTRKLIKMGRLKSILKGRLFLSTWPDSTYPFGVAIDHILYRGNLTCIGTGTLDGLGSDHRMLVAEMLMSSEPTPTHP